LRRLVVIFKGLAKSMGNVAINAYIEVVKLILAEIRPAERNLQRKAVHDVQLLP
jgi:hypothetical protein